MNAKGVQHSLFSGVVWTNCLTKLTAAVYWKTGR